MKTLPSWNLGISSSNMFDTAAGLPSMGFANLAANEDFALMDGIWGSLVRICAYQFGVNNSNMWLDMKGTLTSTLTSMAKVLYPMKTILTAGFYSFKKRQR